MGILKGKKGIIFGALDENSIAWKVAERAHEEGAEFLLTNAPVAMRMGKIQQLAEKCNTDVVAADATLIEDLEKLISEAQSRYGGVDFILHSIGMSPNVRKGRPYTDVNYDFFLKTLDISALSFHKVLQVAFKMEALNEWASVLALSYIAAQRSFPGYDDMAEAKSVLESIARSFGYHLGKKSNIRVNTISQSPTMTTAGSGIKGFGEFFNYADKMSPLGNAPSEACANFCLAMFSDYTRWITMQNLYHDGGFSSVGVSREIMDLVK